MLLVHLHVYLACVSFFVFFSSSWCRGPAEDCDCGTPWTFSFNVLRMSVEFRKKKTETFEEAESRYVFAASKERKMNG